jgi:pyruvate kinase
MTTSESPLLSTHGRDAAGATRRPRARIIGSLGPASSTADRVRALIDAGMDAARLNFSHGTHDEHRAHVERVRAAAEAAGRAVGVMADLAGPKIRLGTFAAGPVRLEAGAEFTITSEPVDGDLHRASTTYEDFARDVKPGDTVLVNDGLVRLEALRSDGVGVTCRVAEGGEISDHKGINLPGVRVSAPTLTPKDLDDLRFALALGVDMVALSFVRGAGAARDLRRAMDECGRRVPIVAKIEKPEAVLEIEEIVRAFDGILVARGDLGVEMPLEDVPLVQKHAIRMARRRAKPVIVATQMLDSMVSHSRPTRAEVSDVANAVLDGADALLLTTETTIGQYPVEAVATMGRIIAAAEVEDLSGVPAPEGGCTVQEAVARAAAESARRLGAHALVAFTRTGSTARQLASHREPVPLFAFTSEPAVRNQLSVVWGVETFVVPDVRTTDEMVAQVTRAMLELGRGEPGDLVVMVAGTPPGAAGSTNSVRVLRLGSA